MRCWRSVADVAEFIVEAYVSRADAAAVERGTERAHLAADEVNRRGADIRLLRSIYLPGDETWLLLYEAASEAAVRDAVARAALSFERVVEAVLASSGEER